MTGLHLFDSAYTLPKQERNALSLVIKYSTMSVKENIIEYFPSSGIVVLTKISPIFHHITAVSFSVT